MRKHPLAHCETCPLSGDEGKYVQSRIPAAPKYAIVGEAPTLYDYRQGKPLSGSTGQLVSSVLSHHGINKSEVLVTNIVACASASKSEIPQAAIDSCKPRLMGELQANKVERVITLGNPATKAILGKDGVTKLRVGPPKESSIYPGIKVIPTINPGAIFKQADQFLNIVTDFGKLNREYAKWSEPKFIVADSELLALQLIEQLRSMRPERLVIDIETHIEKDNDFGHPNQYGMLCVGICYERGKVLVLGEDSLKSKLVRDALGLLLRQSKLGAQNGKFDIKGLYPLVGSLQLWFDTLIASYTLDERPGIHSLEYMGNEILGTPDWKHVLDPWQPKIKGYGNIPRPILYKYNAFDCAITWDLIEYFEVELDKQSSDFKAYPIYGTDKYTIKTLRDAHDFMVDASNELVFVELNGLPVDKSVSNQLDEEFETELSLLRIKANMLLPNEKTYDKAGGINLNSPMQLKKVFADFGVVTASTDAAHCEFILSKRGPETPIGRFITILMEHRKMAKDYGTYVKGIREKLYRGRVYPNFLLHGTTNGRLSCRNPNLQNIPRKSNIRRQFIPSSPENVFVQADYSQAELRVLSYLAGDTYYKNIFNEGTKDVFDDLSQNYIFPDFPKATTDKELYKDLRVRVKAYVYGLAYGRTEYGISAELGISVADARLGMERFFSAIPEIIKWQEWVKKEIENGNELISPFGRHRRFSFITDENHDNIMREALSFLPSSTSSDICLRAAVKLRREGAGLFWMRNLVHDSILVECKATEAEYVQELLVTRMVESGQELVGNYVKFAADSSIGYNWGEL